MSNSWRKFRLLVWKNWTTQRRHWIQTTLEVVAPLVFSLFLILIRQQVNIIHIDETATFEPFSPNYLPPLSAKIPLDGLQVNSTSKVPNEALSTNAWLCEYALNNTLPDNVQTLKLAEEKEETQAWLEKTRANETIMEELDKLGVTYEIVKINAEMLMHLDKNGVTLEDVKRSPSLLGGLERNATTTQNRHLTADTWTVFYTPESPILEKFMQKVSADKFVACPVSNEYELVSLFSKQLPHGQPMKSLVLAGIVFPAELESASYFPSSLNIMFRFPGDLRQPADDDVTWSTNLLYPIYELPGPRYPKNMHGGPPGYHSEGFLFLQSAISSAFLRNVSNNTAPVMDIKLQRLPYPPYDNDPLLTVMKDFIPICIILSFVFSAMNLVRTIAGEKQSRIKESLKVMGLTNWIQWTAWFVKSLVFFAISIGTITVMWKTPIAGSNQLILPLSDWTCILVFLFIYIIAAIIFCFAISSLFSKSNIATVSTGLIWYFSYIPYDFIKKGYQTRTIFTKLAACLLPNTAMAFGFQFVITYEGKGAGLQWNNMWTPSNPGETMTVGYVMVALLIDCVIYMVFTIYVEAVFPGEYGVPLPFYYPFTRSYWFGEKIRNDEVIHDACSKSKSVHEPGPKNYKEGVQIRGLSKKYSGGKLAVDSLSLDLYENQITVLLGHNGAGKTTTMSILTGLYTPTSGTAFINGNDIRKRMDQVQKSLGVCPQFNTLFDQLTVKEHLDFFGNLKGLSGEALNRETYKFLDVLELHDKANSLSTDLSGGMQKKLAAALALCGGSKVVLFDEPTSGMDPGARRDLWDLLQAEKVGRTILLTTHFMDEADILGDRIAIMSEGQLQCVGSPFFLKKRYGGGYQLILVKGSTCTPSVVTTQLDKHMPGISPTSDVGCELTYHLDDKYLPKFETIFAELEANKTSLGVLSYGVSLTTMEEVFVKVLSESEPELKKLALAQEIELDNILERKQHNETVPDFVLMKGCSLFISQTVAMWYKHMLATYRAWLFYLIIVLLTVINLFLAVNASKSFLEVDDLPVLGLSLKDYDGSVVVLTKIGNMSSKLVKEYRDIVAQDTRDVRYMNALGTSTNLSSYILKGETEDMAHISQKYVLGTSFQKDKVTTMFNDKPYHLPPLALSYVYNAILRAYVGENYSINFFNYPLPYDDETKAQLTQLQGDDPGYMMAYHVGFSFAFVFAYFVVFPIRERTCKTKHLQFTSGVNVVTYWVTSFLWDLLTCLGPIAAVMLFYIVWQQEGFCEIDELVRQSIVMLSSTAACLPLMYLASMKIDAPATGFALMTMFNLLTGVVPYIAVFILETPALEKESFAHLLDTIFTIFPSYSLTFSLKSMHQNYLILQACREPYRFCDVAPSKCCQNSTICPDGKCIVWTENYFDFDRPGIGWNLTVMAAVAVVLFTLLLLVEHDVISMINCECMHRMQKNHSDSPEEKPNDEDVWREQQKVREITNNGTNGFYNLGLLIQNVSKYYDNFRAVKNLNLAVKQGECFGLLGVNGAGKTTTFKMLTGDETISTGDVYVRGLSLKCDMDKVRRLIGYCPQFDAILEELTGRETLRLFCMIRGVPMSYINQLSEELAKELLLIRYIDKKVREYSGGNKRKLSAAVALLGNPPVVYLDEPTTGMDPVAKRHLWNALSKRRALGKTIVLTSHSMEECEALCTRLAIMVNGEFKCLGSVQHLKHTFAKGYTLSVKIQRYDQINTARYKHSSLKRRQSHVIEGDTVKVKRFVRDTFPGAELREEYQGLLTFELPRAGVTWARMFGTMESARDKLKIDDYSLGQTSLEQVFLSFTRLQETITNL